MNIRCDCDKLLAKYKDGKLYLYCKRCRKEKEIKIENTEPKSQAKNSKALFS